MQGCIREIKNQKSISFLSTYNSNIKSCEKDIYRIILIKTHQSVGYLSTTQKPMKWILKQGKPLSA